MIISGRGLAHTFLLLIILLPFPSPVVSAQNFSSGVAAFDRENPRVEAELIFDVEAVAPGKSFRTGIHFRIDPDWHIYWQNSGDSGYATEVEFSSDVATFGQLNYPAPKHIKNENDSALTYGYHDETLLFATSTVSASATGAIDVNASIRFLTCKVTCIPGELQLSSVLPISLDETAGMLTNENVFDRFKDLYPVSPESLGISVKAHLSSNSIRAGESFELGLTLTPCRQEITNCSKIVDFHPALDVIALDLSEAIKLESAGLQTSKSEGISSVLLLRGQLFSGMKIPEKINAVVSVSVDDAIKKMHVSIGIPGTQGGKNVIIPIADLYEVMDTRAPRNSMNLWIALALGLAGGLILNVMPCVLPVLVLKTLRLVDLSNRVSSSAHAAQRSSTAVAIAYLSGVLLSMLVLANLVIIMKIAGQHLGWGFQFQHPLFLLLMAALLTIFSLNLFNVFDFAAALNCFPRTRIFASATGVSFLDGALMVLLATPCSAPFLGTAIGFALASDNVTIVLIFASVGVGLSLPYCACVLAPNVALWIPRPGEWMLRVRVILGFLLLATVLWLIWVFGQTVGVTGTTYLLGLLLVLAFVFWCLGLYQSSGAHPRIGVLLTLVLSITSIYATESYTSKATNGTRVRPYETWHPDKVKRLLEENKSVLINFTADWCLVCKINEKTVLENRLVKSELERLKVVILTADWTLPDEVIRQALQRHHRAGVPLYLLYNANTVSDNRNTIEPVVLPEILTREVMLSALSKIDDIAKSK